MNLKPEAIRPVEIHTVEDEELYIEWQDGHRALYRRRLRQYYAQRTFQVLAHMYSFPYLRRKCRCAGCVDEWTGREKLLPEKVSETIRSLKMGPAGNYGIRFNWSDGHSTGIYAFEYLRSLCPCKECFPAPE